MTQLPAWLVFFQAIAAIFSSVVLGLAGLYFTSKQWKFAKGQPQRDLEAHRRALIAAKHQRLIGDFAVILRASVAQKEYIRLQNVVVPSKDPIERTKQFLDFLNTESEGLSLAFARVRLEGVDEEILKISNEQGFATAEFISLNEKLFELIDKNDGSDLTYLSNSVDEARAFAIQKVEPTSATHSSMKPTSAEPSSTTQASETPTSVEPSFTEPTSAEPT